VLMGVCTVAVANSDSSSRPSARTSAAPAATAAPTAKPTTAAAPARDGSCSPQPCANDNCGWIVTISNVRYGAQASEFEKPEAGNVFVMVDVTFTNRLDLEQHANPTEFVLADGAGIKHTWRPLAEGCATWEPVNLTKGATLGPKCDRRRGEWRHRRRRTTTRVLEPHLRLESTYNPIREVDSPASACSSALRRCPATRSCSTGALVHLRCAVNDPLKVIELP
jgi:hypothetical protein